MKRLPSVTPVNVAIQRELQSNFDVVKLVANNMEYIKTANEAVSSGAIESAAVVMIIKDHILALSNNMQSTASSPTSSRAKCSTLI